MHIACNDDKRYVINLHNNFVPKRIMGVKQRVKI